MQYEEIMRRCHELTHGPIYAIPEDRMAEIVRKLEAQTPQSKQLYEEALTCIPGGFQHMLVNRNPYPFTIKKALGSRMWDVDDNAYIDYLMMAGPVILGHNYPPLIKEVVKVMQEEGVGTGWTSAWEIKITQLIKKHFPSIDLFTFFQSGTEANMAASRLVRVYTGKKKIVKMGGSYHGWYDPFLYAMHIPHSGLMDAEGVPGENFAHLVCIDPPYDLEATEKALKTGEVAAVFIEPLGGESGAIPMPPDFPKEIRRLCTMYGTLLVFDEVVTAFRLGMGGAQAYYGVQADVTILGKLITHGFPSSGGVGGRKDIMECFVSGLQPGKGRAFIGGTMRANPLSTAAGYWALTFIAEEDAIEKAAQAADRLTKGLNDLFGKMGFPFFAYNIKSFIHFETAAPIACDLREEGMLMSALQRKAAVDNLATALLSEGLITKYGNRAFTSMAHSDHDIDLSLEAFEKVFRLIPQR